MVPLFVVQDHPMLALLARKNDEISLGIRVNICLPTTHELAEGTRGVISLFAPPRTELAIFVQYWTIPGPNDQSNVPRTLVRELSCVRANFGCFL